MAKKKPNSPGASMGLIIVLIFFVLGTFGAGTMAYFGYSEQDQIRAEAKKAKEDQTKAESQYRVERARKVLLRIALQIDDPEDRVLLVREMGNLRPEIKDEYERVLRGLDGKVPNVLIDDPTDKGKKPKKIEVPGFTWRLLDMSASAIQAKNDAGADGIKDDLDVGPVRTLPQLISEYKDREKVAKAEAALARNDAEDLKKQVVTETDKYGALQKKFADDLAKIQKDVTDRFAMMDKSYKDLFAKHMDDAKKAIDEAKKFGAESSTRADAIAKLADNIKDLQAKLEKYDSDKSNRLAAAGVDFLNLEEKKGEITRKDDNGFVTVNIGSSKKLRPQVTFLVVASNVSWLALLEKEEALKKSARTNDRQPFEENPYVKAGIEIVEVLGPESARAKIIFENEPIRNPVQPRDQIFNLAWQPDEEIRIAFAGIIDLDGDGLDNNEEFLRLLERQGVVVDEFLKMKPLEFVKRDNKGMTLRTKYLVIAPDPRLDSLPVGVPDTPQTLQIKAAIEKLSDIQLRARELGVQMIEARKFLALIGYKLPKNPAPPAYGASAYLDQGAAPPPEPKKGGN